MQHKTNDVDIFEIFNFGIVKMNINELPALNMFILSLPDKPF